KLTPDAQTELAANFSEHVEASEKHAARLVHTGDANASLSVQSDLEARLTAHEQILTVIATHYDLATSTTQSAAETKVALAQLLSTVRDHQSAIVSTRLALEDSISPQLASSAKMATESAAASTSPEVATTRGIRFGHHVIAPAARIAIADAARTEEVTNILDRHATLLAKFLPVATTTASTTATTTVNVATTTASTTSEVKIKNSENTDGEIVNP
ncbi:MAG: hypothetical protein JWL75_311, partial [Parcubacteria group bacterium]|nr:hypothetical protein [Parcubacteria group bacterium]